MGNSEVSEASRFALGENGANRDGLPTAIWRK